MDISFPFLSFSKNVISHTRRFQLFLFATVLRLLFTTYSGSFPPYANGGYRRHVLMFVPFVANDVCISVYLVRFHHAMLECC